MWRFPSKIIFPRWNKVRQTTTKCRSCIVKEPAQLLLYTRNKKNSHDESNDEQHANRQHQNFSDDPHYQNVAFSNNLLESVVLAGTTALCLDMQHKLWQSPYRDGHDKRCLFSSVAFAMPRRGKIKKGNNKMLLDKQYGFNNRTIIPYPLEQGSMDTTAVDSHTEKSDLSVNGILDSISQMTIDSIGKVENSIGLMFVDHNERQAFEFFKASAQMGCLKGIFNLALCYETGCGTTKDLKKAASYYEKASLLGHGLATYNLAVFTLEGMGDITQNYEKGLKLMKVAAENGISAAQVYLGSHYLETENWSSAFEMFEKASSNNMDAKYYLALCYENGWGVARNKVVATEIYAQAAQLGHEEATLKLGSFYENGFEGIDPNEDFSMTLYRMLADKGHEGGKRAMEALDVKRKSRWKFQFRKQFPAINSKPSTLIHASASVPELNQLYKLSSIQSDLSKSSSLLAFKQFFPPKSSINSSNMNKCQLDLAVKNTFNMSPVMSYIVVAQL